MHQPRIDPSGARAFRGADAKEFPILLSEGARTRAAAIDRLLVLGEFAAGFRSAIHSAADARVLALLPVILAPVGLIAVEFRFLAVQQIVKPRDVGLVRRARRDAVYQPSLARSHVFDDRFHYGIQQAANTAGYLCERADLATFTGDVIAWVKDRIDTASLLVADLSTANPNVYLEVGYAWGKGIPTVLLAGEAADLRFDVKGQRCLIYKNIRTLEDLLTRELKNLRPKAV